MKAHAASRLLRFSFPVLVLCAAAPAGAELPDHDQVARQLRQEVLTLANNPHEPGAVLLHVGRDPVRIAAAVEAGIAWQPEFGVIRGPAGTLSAGAGGDWDRAALLQAVLESAGFPTRLAVVERSATERRQVVARFLESGGRASGVRQRAESGDAELLERFGFPARNHERIMATAAARWHRMMEEAFDAGERIGRHLAGRLDAPDMGPPAGFDFPSWHGRLEAAAREAVAVETLTDGGWTLFPLGSDAADIDWERAKPTSRVPAEVTAEFKIGLFMTVVGKDGSTASVPLLEHATELADLFRRPIHLEIAPAGADEAQDNPGSWTAREWYEKVKAFDRFQAILNVGRETYASPIFDMAGQIHQVGRDGRIEGATQVGGAVRRGFGGIFGGPRTDDDEAESQLESIVMTLEIRLPGIEAASRKRLLYGALRPETTPVLQTDLVAAGGPVGSASVLWMALDAHTANAATRARTMAAATPTDYPRAAAARMPEMIYEWFLARMELAHMQLAGNPELILVAGPAVTMCTTQLVRDDSGERIFTRTAMDVVLDDLHLGSRSPEGASAALRANVSLGAACTAVEALLLRDRMPFASILTVLADAEIALARGMEHPGAVQPTALAAWGIEHNEAGRALFFPGHEPSRAWWSVDPATGAIIGRGDGGEGQAVTEYGNIQRQNLNNLKCFLQAFGGGSGREYLACMTGADDKLAAAVGLRSQFDGFEGQGKLLGHLSDALTIAIGWSEYKESTGGAK